MPRPDDDFYASFGGLSGVPGEPFEEGAYIRVDFNVGVRWAKPARMARAARCALQLSHAEGLAMAKAAHDRKPWNCGPYPLSTASRRMELLQRQGLNAYLTSVPLEKS